MANTCKYYKEQRYISRDNGNTWQGLNEYRKGVLYEANSPDCIVGTQYMFFDLNGEYICENAKKYNKTQKFVSNDGVNWEPVTPYIFDKIGEAIYDEKTQTNNLNMDCFKAYWHFTSVSSSWPGEDAYTECNDSSVLTNNQSTDMPYLPMGYTSSTITKVVVGNCVTRINAIRPFEDEHSVISELILPDSLLEFGNHSCASSLTINFLDIPSGVTNIEYEAFGHNYIGGAYLPRSLEQLGDGVFTCCSGLTTIDSDLIPPNITIIPNSCFSNNVDVTTIDIPEGVTEIGNSAFDGCLKLNRLTLPNSLKIIGGNAFRSCFDNDTWLTNEVTIPSGVTDIRDYAFNGCDVFKYHLKPTTPPTLHDINNTLGTFTIGKTIIIYVPCEAFEDYWNDEKWSYYRRWLRQEGCEPLYSYQELTSAQDWMCVNGTKYNKSYYSVSYNNGHTWEKVIPLQYKQGSLKTSDGGSCTGDRTVKLQWINVDGTTGLQYGSTSGNDVISANTTPTYSSILKSAIISDSVIEVGIRAFKDAEFLEDINIPNSVVRIGDDAFYHCRKLSNVTLSNNLIRIGQNAFIGCTSLSSITIPSSVSVIDYDSFYGCSNLREIIMEGNTPPIINSNTFKGTNEDLKIYVHCEAYAAYQSAQGWSAYQNKIRIIEEPCEKPPKKYKLTFTTSDVDIYCENSGYTFNSASISNYGAKSDLTEAILYDCVSYLSPYSFSGCSSLSSVTLPNSITSIGYECFFACYNLSSIYIPNNVTTIGYNAFQNCGSLVSCTLGNSVRSIEHGAFRFCSSLENIFIPDNVTDIGFGIFNGCSNLKNCTIGNGVTKIPNLAFNKCYSLSSVTIGNNVTSIGDSGFTRCDSLTSITIPNSVTSIGEQAFYGLSKLLNVTIGSGITSIGYNAFEYCSKLENVTVNALTPPTLDTDVFYGSTCPIYVPASSVNAYKSARRWSKYADRIQAIPSS